MTSVVVTSVVVTSVVVTSVVVTNVLVTSVVVTSVVCCCDDNFHDAAISCCHNIVWWRKITQTYHGVITLTRVQEEPLCLRKPSGTFFPWI